MTGGALLRGLLREERRRVGLAATLLSAHQVFEALVPVVVGATLDQAIEPSDEGALIVWLVVLAALFTVLSFSYRYGSRLAEALTETAAHRLRLRLVERVIDPRGGGEGGRLPGELLSVATADVDAASGIVRGATYGAAVFAALAAGAVALVLTSWLLGLVVLVGLPVIGWLGERLGRWLMARAEHQQERAAEAAGVATDLVGGLRVLQGIGGAGPGAARYRDASRSSLDATVRAAPAEAAIEGGAMLVGGVALAAVALVGGRLAAQGDLSIGALVAAVGVTQFLVGPLSRLGWVATLLARARASAGRLAAALSVPPAIAVPEGAAPRSDAAVRDAAAPRGGGAVHGAASSGEGAAVDGARSLAGALRVRGLHAGPLRGLDLELEAGGVYGLVLDDPAAADALLDCLGREVEPEAGELAVDGVALTALHPADARAAVAVAPHDAALLADTVTANVAAAADGDEEAVRRASAAAAVDDVVAALPDGDRTVLSDAGRSLSGGQRQRIALARALAAPAPVLVLHEPTTALDAATEARVAAALRGARAGRTTLLVTTSPALLAACDVVVVVREGRATTTATHARLVEHDAVYRELVLA